MLPTVVDLWPDCDLLAIDDGVTVVMVAEWDSRIVVNGVCVGHSQGRKSFWRLSKNSNVFLSVIVSKQVCQYVYICKSTV